MITNVFIHTLVAINVISVPIFVHGFDMSDVHFIWSLLITCLQPSGHLIHVVLSLIPVGMTARYLFVQ